MNRMEFLFTGQEARWIAPQQTNDHSIVAIIPLYNGARWIEGAIRSVFAQTLQPDEFIVVDDGSTDDGAGAAIVERLANEGPITLLHKENGGQSSARNFGIAHSKSALIALLDQDDVWYPNHLAELVKPFRKAFGIPLGWVYSDLAEIDEAGRMIRHSMLKGAPTEHPKHTLLACLSHDMFVLPSASLISRKAFETVGGFDQRLCGYEDDDLFLRIFRAGYGDIFLDQSLSAWRMYSHSTSFTERMAKSRLIYLQKLIDLFPDDKLRYLHYRRDCIAPRFLRTMLIDYLRAFRAGDVKQMRSRANHIKALLPNLRIKDRIVIGIAAPFMRSYLLASMVSRSPKSLKAAVGRRLGMI